MESGFGDSAEHFCNVANYINGIAALQNHGSVDPAGAQHD
jgi:hypothetical protein